MSTDFWSQHVPPDSLKFKDELEMRVGRELSKGLTVEQTEEFERLIDASENSLDNDFDDFYGLDDYDNSDSSHVSLVDRVLYEKYPDGNWQDNATCFALVQKQGLKLGSFELKKELATTIWLEKNSPNFRHLVSETRAALHKEFGHGRVYFHPDLSLKFRDAVLGGDAGRIRGAFVKQKPCPLTVALGNRFLSGDALIRLSNALEKFALPHGGNRRSTPAALEAMLSAFDDEIRQLALRTPAAGKTDSYKDYPGDRRLAEAIEELLSDEALVRFTQSALEADAKEILFSDDESTGLLTRCINRSKAALRLAYDSTPQRTGEDKYTERITDILADLHNTINAEYGFILKSDREGRRTGGV